jgi:hypothetical protein
MRFTSQGVLVCVRLVGPSGSPPPPRPRRFRRGLAALTERRPRLVCTNRFILPFRASSECFRLSTRPRSFVAQAPSLGFPVPHRDIDQRRRCSGLPTPATVRPRRFSRPRRFDPPPVSWVYFTPQPRPGFPRKRCSLSHRRSVSSTSPALSSLAQDRYWQLPTSATIPSPALRASIRARVRCSKRWGLAAARARSLSVLSSSRFSLSRPRRRLHVFTAHDLREGTVKSFPAPISSVSPGSLACLSRGCLPARGSVPAG